MVKQVYNLEFPSWCSELEIFGYHFKRISNYREAVKNLQHFVSVHAEFNIERNTGRHAITSLVQIPESQEESILEWGGKNKTALNDILLLLSIFTQRDVFIVDTQEESDKPVITADPRRYCGGGILRCSIPYKGQPIDPRPYRYNIGFQEGINQIYMLIRSDEWQLKYKRGYFLFLTRSAFRWQILEARFLQCWTIWEHLFSILNQNWLSTTQIRSLSASEKISYLLVNYALKDEITKADKKRIANLAQIRNRLVHFGRFPEGESAHDDAILFINLTEFIIAKTLNLFPSNVLNTIEKLEDFFKSTNNQRY